MKQMSVHPQLRLHLIFLQVLHSMVSFPCSVYFLEMNRLISLSGRYFGYVKYAVQAQVQQITTLQTAQQVVVMGRLLHLVELLACCVFWRACSSSESIVTRSIESHHCNNNDRISFVVWDNVYEGISPFRRSVWNFIRMIIWRIIQKTLPYNYERSNSVTHFFSVFHS